LKKNKKESNEEYKKRAIENKYILSNAGNKCSSSLFIQINVKNQNDKKSVDVKKWLSKTIL